MFSHIPQSAVIVLAGVAGSGKSTWARARFRETEILSSDALRATLTDDEEHRACSGDAFAVLQTLLDLRLKYGRRAVIDATSLRPEARRPYLRAAREHGVPAMLVWFDVPEAVCRRRQHLRDRKVPAHAIRRQAELIAALPDQLPDEPWDAIGRVAWVPPDEGGPAMEFELLRDWTPPRVTRGDDRSAQLAVTGLDIIGDVHGCSAELDALLLKLGWRRDPDSGAWGHDEDRMVVFVGDLTDRGPDSVGVLLRAIMMVEQGQALLIRGNHDDKLHRWLQGRNVKLKHGLETTAAEFEALRADQREALTQAALTLLEGAPLWASWAAPGGLAGEPELVIAHAAWQPEATRWPLKRAQAYCMYGPTTGRTDADGLPERLDWRQRLPLSGPRCVFGHNPFAGPVREHRNTIALDTACVFGHRLSALRWPEGDVVQIDAREQYAAPTRPLREAPSYTLDPEEEPVPDLHDDDLRIGPEAAFDLRLDHLLEQLHRAPEAILARVDADPLMIRRTGEAADGRELTLANAGKDLFTPQEPHQLYAKGLVYEREPWRAVSVPFIKIYNFGEREDARALCLELAAAPEVTARFNNKLDGTMVQTFAAGEQVVVTTRGTFELSDPGSSGFDYLSTARRILTRQSPSALDPGWAQGWTLLWELLHPEARLVTDYGDRESLVLLGAVDGRDPERPPRYVPRQELEALAEELGAPVAEEYQLAGETLEARIASLEEALDGTDLEGAVVTFEGEDLCGRPAVLHRIKIKGSHYLRLMRQLTRCTYARTRQLLALNPELRTWEALREHLIGLGSDEVPEEVLSTYRAHLRTWHGRQEALARLIALARRAFEGYVARHGAPPEERGPAYGAWRKDYARWAQEQEAAARGLLFQAVDDRLDVDTLERRLGEAPETIAALEETLLQLAPEPGAGDARDDP